MTPFMIFSDRLSWPDFAGEPPRLDRAPLARPIFLYSTTSRLSLNLTSDSSPTPLVSRSRIDLCRFFWQNMQKQKATKPSSLDCRVLRWKRRRWSCRLIPVFRDLLGRELEKLFPFFWSNRAPIDERFWKLMLSERFEFWSVSIWNFGSGRSEKGFSRLQVSSCAGRCGSRKWLSHAPHMDTLNDRLACNMNLLWMLTSSSQNSWLGSASWWIVSRKMPLLVSLGFLRASGLGRVIPRSPRNWRVSL